MAIAASPAPRKTAFSRNNSRTVAFPPSMIRVKSPPDSTTSSVAPIRRRRAGAFGAASSAIAAAAASPSRIDCPAA